MLLAACAQTPPDEDDPPSVTLSPKAATVNVLERVLFTVTVPKTAGEPTYAVTWSASAGSVEPIDTHALAVWFYAPAEAGEVTITATLGSEPPVNDTATVTVEPDPDPDPDPDPESVRLLAAGDIACSTTDEYFNEGEGDYAANRCMQMRTAVLAESLEPDAVVALGDLQYTGGEYGRFMGSYHPSWGRLNDVIYPMLGNHELYRDGADGYVRYFDEQGVWDRLPDAAADYTKAYYAFDLGAWRVILLNTNCEDTVGRDDSVDCDVGSDQHTWLVDELAAATDRCTLVAFHQPRFNSGRNGDEPLMEAFWRAAHDGGVDLILAADEHRYERYHPLNADGERDDENGVLFFIVGTGGKELYGPYDPSYPTSAKKIIGEYGVLQVDLYEDHFDFEFVPAEGYTSTDSGTGGCH